jgi:hypothetical protein
MPIKSLKFRSSVRAISAIISENAFNGFPIINSDNQCIGIINRYSLLIILRNINRIKGLKSLKEPPVERSYAQINSDTGRSSLDLISESEHIGTNTNEDDEDNDMVERLSPLDLDWSDFNVDFHSNCPDVNMVEFQ